MIFEIELEKNINISDYIQDIQSLGDFIICNSYLYLNSIKDISVISQTIPIKKCQYITSSNYKEICSDFCRKWCMDSLYKQELLEFEKTPECQERLKFINKQLDILERGAKDNAKKESAKE